MCQSSSPPPPATPDYTGAAIAQGAANVDAARASAKLSNPNIFGPTGSQTVTYEGDVPTIRQTLNPNAQAALDAQQRVQMDLSNLGEKGIGTAQSALSSPFSASGVPNVQTSLDTSGLPQAPVNAGTTGQEAIMARLAPQLQREDADLRNRLANQGLVAGGEAYDREMNLQGQRANDLETQAALQGISLDTGARSNAFNEELQGAQFGNAASDQSLSRQLALRNQPLNEITALMSGGQIQLPQFQGYQGQNVTPAPVFNGAQAQGAANMQQYGIQSAAANANKAGLYGLAGAGLMAL